MSCFICDKHSGSSNQPPGGYIYEDEHWSLCHFPVQQSILGRLVLESNRHFLDFSEMTDEEARSYGILVKKIYSLLKQETGAERIYSLITIEGVPHFHEHFFPRTSDSPAKGMKLFALNCTCSEADAISLVSRLSERFRNET